MGKRDLRWSVLAQTAAWTQKLPDTCCFFHFNLGRSCHLALLQGNSHHYHQNTVGLTVLRALLTICPPILSLTQTSNRTRRPLLPNAPHPVSGAAHLTQVNDTGMLVGRKECKETLTSPCISAGRGEDSVNRRKG